MTDNPGLDDKLAALTDRLLAGEHVETEEELSDLADVVQKLHRLLAPDTPVDPAMRARLAHRLKQEWAQRHVRTTRQSRPWYTHRLVPLAAAAAAMILLLTAVAVLSGGGRDQGDSLQGAASGSFAWGLAIGLVLGIGIVSLGFWWFRKQRRK